MRKQAKRKLKWGPVVWLFLVANAVAGMLWSPLTSARQVRVIGAQDFDRFRIEKEIDVLRKQPWLRADELKLKEKLIFSQEVASVTIKRNPFGRCEVKMVYRKPVALLNKARAIVLSADGHTFRTRQNIDELPQLKIGGRISPLATFMARVPVQRIAGLCERVAKREYLKGAEIEMLTTGSVCLNLGESTKIELGALEELDEKIKTLDRLVGDDPQLLQGLANLNLMAPDQPKARKIAQ